MRIIVSWPDGGESELFLPTLRALDELVGHHMEAGHRVDLSPLEEGLRLSLSPIP